VTPLTKGKFEMKKLAIAPFILVILVFINVPTHAYVNVAAFDGKTLYIPTLRNGKDVIYDVELVYVDKAVFKLSKVGKTLATNTPVISTYSAVKKKIVIQELQYRFQTFANVAISLASDGNLSMNSAELLPEAKASSVEIYNLTSYTDQYLQSLVVLAESKMANLEADILAVFYPLGEFISPDQPPTTLTTSFRGATFQKVLANQDRAAISSRLEEFLKPSCPQLVSWTASNAKVQADILTDWILAGGGGQSQEVYCPTRRIFFVSIQPDRYPLMENLDLERVIFHELYHGFQQDLVYGCPGNKESGWIIEAGAEYFAQHLISVVQGKPQKFGASVLIQGAATIERHGKELADPSIAEKGLVAFRYMVEKGWLDESRVLDGSFYHNCARNKDISDSDELLGLVKANWSNIFLSEDGYKFSE
jgi:hypothetical protein